MKSFKKFLIENYSYSSVQVKLPTGVSESIIEYANKLPDDIIYHGKWGGRENRPHITVKYGIHTDDVEVIKGLPLPQATLQAKMGKVNLFEGKENDVLIVEINSPDLTKLNKLISNSIPVTDTHPVYKPHSTIAYIQKGSGSKYKGDTIFEDIILHFNEIEFSSKAENNYIKIPLNQPSLKR